MATKLVSSQTGVATRPGAHDFAVPGAPDGDEAHAEDAAHSYFGTPSTAETTGARSVPAPRHLMLLVTDAAQKHDAHFVAMAGDYVQTMSSRKFKKRDFAGVNEEAVWSRLHTEVPRTGGA